MKRMVLQALEDGASYQCILYIPNHRLYRQPNYDDAALYQAVQHQHCSNRYLGELGQQRFARSPGEGRLVNFNQASVMIAHVHYANVPLEIIDPNRHPMGQAPMLIGVVTPTVGAFHEVIHNEFRRQLDGCTPTVRFAPRVLTHNGHISKIVAFDLISLNEVAAEAA